MCSSTLSALNVQKRWRSQAASGTWHYAGPLVCSIQDPERRTVANPGNVVFDVTGRRL